MYQFMSGIFPNSFTAKVFAVAFVGTHVPLIALLLRAVAQNGPLSAQIDIIIWALVATVVGTAATLVALHSILKPLYRVEEAMRRFEETGEIQVLPFGYGDEVGRLMDRTNRLVLHVGDRLEESAREAETDPLTGVANRRGFERQLGASPKGAVLLLDIDHFKAVNDALGHVAGDVVLRTVAGVMQAALRKGDILARLGGEEFVIYLPDTSPTSARAIAERVRAAIETNVQAGGASVTVSVGLAQVFGGDNLASAIDAADRGAYAAKAAGRNRVAADPDQPDA
ncbi:MAG: GGDEF domain-containing protein [Gemmobacter sp.]|nr:GGDEF domain-containing protein [Gemmobacter sp.]